MKFCILLIFTLGLSASVHSANLTDFLKSVKRGKANLELTKPTPFINSVKLRLGESSSEKQGDSYTEKEKTVGIRFYTSSFHEYQVNHEMYENQKERYRGMLNQEQSQATSMVYKAYIDLLHGLEMRTIYNNLAIHYKDKLKVLKSLLKKGQMKLEDVVKNQEAFNENQLDYLRVDSMIKDKFRFLASLSDKKIKLSDFKGKTISLRLRNLLKKISNTNTNKLKSISIAALEYEQMELEYQIEKNKESRILDYVEFTNGSKKYDIDKYEKTIGIRASFNLPFSQENRSKMNEKVLARVKGQSRVRDIKRIIKLRYDSLVKKIHSLNTSLELIGNSDHLKQAQKYLKIFKKRKSSSPLKLLAFNEVILESKLKKSILRQEAYNTYIDVLLERGDLAKYSTENFLSRNVVNRRLK